MPAVKQNILREAFVYHPRRTQNGIDAFLVCSQLPKELMKELGQASSLVEYVGYGLRVCQAEFRLDLRKDDV
jgi:hypothetical protein